MWRFSDIFSIVLIILKSIISFNIDTTSPIVYVDPLNGSNYFGYSIVLYPGNNTTTSWIFIGSPRGQSNKNYFNNSGVCYKCGIKQNCKIFKLEERTNALGFGYREKLDGAWIGGSMDINYNLELVVTCGFRSIKIKYYSIDQKNFFMNGACYWFHVNDNNTQKLFPFIDQKDIYTDRTYNKSVYYYGQGQAGFSIHMPSMVSGDLRGISQPTVSRMIKRVSENIAAQLGQYVKLPQNVAEQRSNIRRFHAIAGFPGVAGCVDCTHIAIASPGGENAEVFRNRKGFFSLNVQSKPEILLGAPGVLNWYGTSLLYRDNNIPIKIQSKKLRSYLRNIFNSKFIGNSILTTQTEGNDFLGYSSSSGYFYNRKKLYYVSGAPRSKEYRGQVLIYQFPSSEKGLVVKEVKYGDQFGEYFGASLTSGDINSDGLDDLIVGAPTFAAKEYNEGKIHIFKGNSKELLRFSKREYVVGKKVNGQFGFTVQYLGDINHDGFGVSAPYEENTGVVYIFRGSYNGLETVECQRVECQRIVGKDISADMRGFGISIPRPSDIDSNQYLDMAIGAPISGHAVLLRARPSVTIFQSLRTFSDNLKFQQKSFLLESCFWYKLDQISTVIRIYRTLSIDVSLQRANLQDANYTEIVELKSNETVCENYTVNLKNSISERFDPLLVSLSHYFEENHSLKKVVYIEDNVVGRDSFCLHCPVYNRFESTQTTTLSIPFSLGCRKHNICEASLEFHSTINNLRENNVFVLGTTDYLTLKTTIKNLGEKAYLTKLEVRLPKLLRFQFIPPDCEQNASYVVCSLDNPLDTNSEKNLGVYLDVSSLNRGKYDEESLAIVVTVVTSSSNNLNNKKTLNIKLVREADVTIYGQSGEQSYFYRNALQTQLQFDQIYQIEKFGSSSLGGIIVELDIPHIFQTDKGEDINFVSLNDLFGNYQIRDRPITCISDFKYISEKTFDHIGSKSGSYINNVWKRSVNQDKMLNESTIKSQKFMKNDETFYINCTMTEVSCTKVRCFIDSIKNSELVSIYLRMVLNISAIKCFLDKKDILYTTHGFVNKQNIKNLIQISSRPDSVYVSSLIVGQTPAEEIETWIIVISVTIGLLLVLLLIVALVKCGFFKREIKEELLQLKNEMEETNMIVFSETQELE